MMMVAAVSRVVVAKRYENAMVARVGERDRVSCGGRVAEENWTWRCRRCGAKGAGKRYQCECGMGLCPEMVNH